MNADSRKNLLRVASPSNATMQQPHPNDATGYATATQQPITEPQSLLDLARNKLRNNHATITQKGAQQAPLKQGEDVARVEKLCAMNREKELTRLVRLVSDHEGFTETEHKEALEGALADPVNALTCFSSLARRIESLKSCNSVENGTTS